MIGKIISKYNIKEKDRVLIIKNAKRSDMPTEKLIDQIIRGLIGDAMSSQEKIIKEQRKILRLKRNIGAMVFFLNEVENKSESAIAFNQQFYDDLFRNRINSVLSKIKL